MRVQVVTRHTLGGGAIAEVGDLLDLPERVAIERIHTGRCIPAPAAPPETEGSGVPGGARAPSATPAGGGAGSAEARPPADGAPPAPPEAGEFDEYREVDEEDDDSDDEKSPKPSPSTRKKPGGTRR